MKSRGTRFPFTNLSLEQRLPLLMGGLLIAVMGVAAWASYSGVKDAAFEVGRERLRNLTQLLTGLFQQSSAILATKTLAAANDPAIRAFLLSPSAGTRSNASAILNQFSGAQDPNSLQLELWDANHSLVLASPERSPAVQADMEGEFKQCAVDPFKAFGVIRQVNGVLVYPLLTAVKGDAGTPLGYLVRWRKIAATPESRKQLTDLLGSQAALYFGNREGEFWTDSVKVVPGPPASARASLDVVHYERDGNSVMAMGRPIVGTPWFLVLEFPDQTFLAQAHHFLRRMSIFSLGLLVAGLGGALLVSRSITRPLQALTDAATAISGGDYTRLVNTQRTDELGTLNNAFNSMVVQVRDSQQQLERKVQERTSELAAANKELAAFSDLTSRGLREKSNELAAMTEQMWQASKLATMGELAASVAHELNNPLATLALRADLLMGQLSAEDPKRPAVEIMVQEVERMATLVGGLLQFSRRSHRQVSTIDAAEEIANSTNFISYYLRNRNVKVVTEFAEDVQSIQADRQQLRQLSLNLLTNACDAMPDGGTIITRTSRGRLNGVEAVVIEFADSGVGIQPANLERIWDSFFTTKPEGKGTGLGLAICRRIVEEHGGTISISSKLNEGTVVRITLPATATGQTSEDAFIQA